MELNTETPKLRPAEKANVAESPAPLHSAISSAQASPPDLLKTKVKVQPTATTEDGRQGLSDKPAPSSLELPQQESKAANSEPEATGEDALYSSVMPTGSNPQLDVAAAISDQGYSTVNMAAPSRTKKKGKGKVKKAKTPVFNAKSPLLTANSSPKIAVPMETVDDDGTYSVVSNIPKKAPSLKKPAEAADDDYSTLNSVSAHVLTLVANKQYFPLLSSLEHCGITYIFTFNGAGSHKSCL